MRVAVLSDAHLAGPDDPNQSLLLRFLDGLQVDRLCVAGDLFHHWWDFGGVPFPEYAPVADALRRFDVAYVPGNHDWRAAAFFGGTPVVRETWDGLRVYVAHGDEVDRTAGYRAASALLRSVAFARVVEALGPARAWRFLARVAGRVGAGTPDARLCEAQRMRATELLGEGADLVVFGHTHAPGVHALPRGTYVNLGDWVRHHTWLLVEDGSVDLRRFDG